MYLCRTGTQVVCGNNRKSNLPFRKIEAPLLYTALKISMKLNKRACIGNIIMRRNGGIGMAGRREFTQSKPGNRFRCSRGRRSRRSFIYVSAELRLALQCKWKAKDRKSTMLWVPVQFYICKWVLKCAPVDSTVVLSLSLTIQRTHDTHSHTVTGSSRIERKYKNGRK